MLSGDSTVESFSFDGEKAVFDFDDYDSDKKYKVVVKTPIIFTESTGDRGCVHMRIEAPISRLEIDEASGIYILPPGFPHQMSVIKKGFHVFVGLKAAVYKKAFLLVGSSKIILCPIKSESCVSISPV
ncbi:MAG: hypothetical protein HUJ31_10570 [Pseudomonadales bacterium]|nr:hypothetical protein [Pseudomonadales bacterium]